MTATTQYYVATSLDGFIADADHGLAWLLQFDGADGVRAHYEAFIADVGAIAMGAHTYDFVRREMPDAWPYPGIPCWVFTRRGRAAPAGVDVRMTADDVAAVHAEMRAAAGGKNIWLVGGGDLVAQFARRGLVDELRVTVTPILLGAGAPLLPLAQTEPLALVGTTTFGRGLVELRYRWPR